MPSLESIQELRRYLMGEAVAGRGILTVISYPVTVAADWEFRGGWNDFSVIKTTPGPFNRFFILPDTIETRFARWYVAHVQPRCDVRQLHPVLLDLLRDFEREPDTHHNWREIEIYMMAASPFDDTYHPGRTRDAI